MTISNPSDSWTAGSLVDSIFNNLSECDSNRGEKQNKYVGQIIDKLKYLRLKLPDVCFEVDKNDLKPETTRQQKSKENEGNSIDNDEIKDKSLINNMKNGAVRPTKMLEVLEVLAHEKEMENKIREKQLYRKWPRSDTWACPNCNEIGDKWHMLGHSCKMNKK